MSDYIKAETLPFVGKYIQPVKDSLDFREREIYTNFTAI